MRPDETLSLWNCTRSDFCGGLQEYNSTTKEWLLFEQFKSHGASSDSLLSNLLCEQNTTTDDPLDIGNSSDSAVIRPPDILTISLEFMFFSLSLIIPLGLVCNTISIMVFMSKKLRNRAASWYLAALAVSDDISLVAIMFDYWLKAERIGLSVIKTSNALCLTVTHLSYASRLFSAVLVTSLTVERFVGVVYPLKRASLSTTSHARRVIAIECVTCILSTSFILCTIGIVDEKYGIECDVIPERKNIYLICNVIFLVFGSIVLPILTICTLNMFILQKIYQRKKHFVPKNMTFSSKTRGGAPYKTKRGYNIATVLLVVSTVFVVLNIPYCVCWFVLFFRYHRPSGAGEINWNLFAAKYITSVPYYLNYAINFALYSLCARAFRLELLKLLKCTPCRQLSQRTGCTETKPTTVPIDSKQKCLIRRGLTPNLDKASKELYEKVLSLPMPQNDRDFIRIMRPETR